MRHIFTAVAAGAAFALVCALALAPASAQSGSPASATRAAPAGWAYDLAGDMMSPFCPGRTLADCPSPQADSLRMWILVQESAGRSRQDVEAELLERYGDVILAAPRAEGFGIAAYAIPLLAFVAGGGLIVWLLRRFTARSAAADAEAQIAVAAREPELDAELERIVEEELARQG